MAKQKKDYLMKTIAQKMIAAGAGLFLTTNVAVYGATLYQNNTVDTGTSLSLVNGTAVGTEVVLAGAAPSDILNYFSFEIVSPEKAFIGNNVQMDISMYANTGAPFNGYATPGASTLWDSGYFSLSTPYAYNPVPPVPPSPLYGATLIEDGAAGFAPLLVPKDFTLVVEVTGLAAADSLGIELFDPATVGSNYGDYWLNSGGGWTLISSPGADFAAVFQGTAAPDAASTAMLLGAALSGLALLRRKLS